MTAEQLKEELDLIVEMRRAWYMLNISPEIPSVSQFQTWLHLHHPTRVLFALSRTSEKSENLAEAGQTMSTDHAIRFLSSVANAQKTIEENEQENDNE